MEWPFAHAAYGAGEVDVAQLLAVEGAAAHLLDALGQHDALIVACVEGPLGNDLHRRGDGDLRQRHTFKGPVANLSQPLGQVDVCEAGATPEGTAAYGGNTVVQRHAGQVFAAKADVRRHHADEWRLGVALALFVVVERPVSQHAQAVGQPHVAQLCAVFECRLLQEEQPLVQGGGLQLVVVAEGISAYLHHAGGHVDGSQRHTAEAFIANLLQRRRQRYVVEAAVAEGTFAQEGETVGQCGRRHRRAAAECPVLDACDAHGDACLLQGRAVIEGGGRYGGEAAAEFCTLQLCTVVEDALAQADDGIGHVHLLQSCKAECIFADGGEALRQRDLLQRRAFLEGSGANGGDALWQRELRERLAVAEGITAYLRNGGGQADALQRRAAIERAARQGGDALGQGDALQGLAAIERAAAFKGGHGRGDGYGLQLLAILEAAFTYGGEPLVQGHASEASATAEQLGRQPAHRGGNVHRL